MPPPRIALPLLIVAVALVAFLALRLERQVSADRGRLEVVRAGDAAVLVWSRPIAHPMARRFEEAFNALKDDADVFVIDLHSPGGALTEGRKVIEVIERMKRDHLVETRVGRDRACLSMCVPIYLAGESRIAAPDARFMFHEPASRNAVTGARVDRPGFEQRWTADRFFRRYFEQSGMDPAWRAWLEEEWKGRDVWKTGAELVEEGSGVVTALER